MSDEKTTNNRLVISFLTIRKAIGFIGIFLPVALLAATFLIGHCTQIQDSISHYYFTAGGDIFVGALCAVALFLIAYKGYDRTDHICTSIAGIAAILVALFPTTQNNDVACSVVQLADSPARVWVHYGAAGVFFLTLSFISFFLFTKSRGAKTPEKVSRNRIYRSCAVIMVICIVLVFIATRESIAGEADAINAVFWLEWIALLAFGTSWLVKGELLLSDHENR